MATKSPERKIYDVFMKATKEGTVPFGYYGPETCRWATQEEMQRFSLKDFPLVHLDEKGDIDCYFSGASRAELVGAATWRFPPVTIDFPSYLRKPR
jgi:hypothetical protein